MKGKRSSHPKSSIEYWKNAVFKPRYGPPNGRRQANDYSVQLRLGGPSNRTTFPLHTPNLEVAARKARKIHQYMVANGFEAAIKEFKRPKLVQQKRDARTFGEFFDGIREYHSGNPKTLADNIRALRRIVADVSGIEDKEGSRYDYQKGGRDEWLKRVHAVPLVDLSRESVELWKARFLKEHGGNPLKDRTARTSVNSILRQAGSLYGERYTRFLKLPEGFTSPFAGVKPEPAQDARHKRTVDFEALVRDALEQLKPDPLKVFLLAGCCGLRRAEIDRIRWSDFNFRTRSLFVATSQYGSTKSRHSEAEIDLDEELCRILQGWRAKAARADEFVVEPKTILDGSGAQPAYSRYRAERSFVTLIKWLTDRGVQATKKLHWLRKEFGSQINEQFGLYAASRALRHGDISVTARHYLDTKARLTVGLSRILSPPPSKVIPIDADQPVQAAQEVAR
jgi:integrase